MLTKREMPQPEVRVSQCMSISDSCVFKILGCFPVRSDYDAARFAYVRLVIVDIRMTIDAMRDEANEPMTSIKTKLFSNIK